MSTINDPVCLICGSRKSEHVATDLGTFTHPREAAGEGRYVLVAAGTLGFGPAMDDQPFERWEFRSNQPLPVTESERRGGGP